MITQGLQVHKSLQVHKKRYCHLTDFTTNKIYDKCLFNIKFITSVITLQILRANWLKMGY